MTTLLTMLRNGEGVPIRNVAELSLEEFLQAVVGLNGQGWRIASYFGVADREGTSLWCVMADTQSQLGVMRSWCDNSLPSIAVACPEAQLFEREIAEQCGVPLEGHPWSKPVRYHRSLRKDHDAWGRGRDVTILPCVGHFYHTGGDEIHEVAVGPVHAGIIEPGHFRFQCHGEKVFHLEIALGYQHRGIEKSIVRDRHMAAISRVETIAGDSTIAHATAYAMIMEGLAECEPSGEAQAIRAIALELERLANHCGDLGALAGDVGYLPTMSFCGRIRGDFLNMTAMLCGSRFGRGLVRPGGVSYAFSPQARNELGKRLLSAGSDYSGAVDLLWSSPSVMARFENTGKISSQDALSLGLVGPAARACGVIRDNRCDHPFGYYKTTVIPVQIQTEGDVFARAMIRWKESEASQALIRTILDTFPAGSATVRKRCDRSASEQLVVSLVEGWRGEICHVALTDKDGGLLHYKIKDPSFNNWSGLAMAMRGQQISDFPLCNKSFNLSYCGFDL